MGTISEKRVQLTPAFVKMAECHLNISTVS